MKKRTVITTEKLETWVIKSNGPTTEIIDEGSVPLPAEDSDDSADIGQGRIEELTDSTG
jgi:hypothetical protein